MERRIVSEGAAGRERRERSTPRVAASRGRSDSAVQKRAACVRFRGRTRGIDPALYRAKNGAIVFRGRCRRAARGVAADGVLPDSGWEAADDPDDVRVAAGAARVDRGAAAGAGAYTPSRCRFRYRPFREIPRALAAASTFPSCSRSAAAIISRSTPRSAGISLSWRGTAIS